MKQLTYERHCLVSENDTGTHILFEDSKFKLEDTYDYF
jgi:hypothetical protein